MNSYLISKEFSQNSISIQSHELKIANYEILENYLTDTKYSVQFIINCRKSYLQKAYILDSNNSENVKIELTQHSVPFLLIGNKIKFNQLANDLCHKGFIDNEEEYLNLFIPNSIKSLSKTKWLKDEESLVFMIRLLNVSEITKKSRYESVSIAESFYTNEKQNLYNDNLNTIRNRSGTNVLSSSNSQEVAENSKSRDLLVFYYIYKSIYC